jgi:CheY-like chemotaxis protein
LGLDAVGVTVTERDVLRVLVADDHEKMRDCLVQILEREFEVIAAVSNGCELVDAATRLKPDVIVSDVLMPVLSGTKALMVLRAGGIHIPFVFVSSDKELVEQVAQNFGVCLHKLDSLSELEVAVLFAAGTVLPTTQINRGTAGHLLH